MSADLDRMYESLLNNQVPEIWTKLAYPSLKPLASWIKDLHKVCLRSHTLVLCAGACFTHRRAIFVVRSASISWRTG
jgi:hypothetical protein